MSIHKSLVPPSKLRRHRNVLTRTERLEILQKEERWDDAKSVFNLPKVRNIMAKAKKAKKEAVEGAEGAAAAAPGAAPAAAGAKAPAAAAGAKAAAPAAGAKAAAPKKDEKKK